MGLYRLDHILKPSSLAVVGASERPNTVGRALVHNLKQGGYQGRVYPVNPKQPEVLGLPAFPSLEAIGQPVDCAVICTAIAGVPEIVRQCGNLGIGGAVIISAGGKEVGPQGAAIEAEIREAARQGKVRLVGPNCLGVVNSQISMNASFAHIMPLPGHLAFISQSGAVCTSVLDYAAQEKIGFSHFISIGSMLDVDFGDLINYLGDDPEVSSILLYMEMVNNHRKFMSAARAVSRVKPIMVLKSGRSQAGAQAAQSHTGSLAGEDAVYDAAFKRAGIVRVDTLGDLFGCAELMAKASRPQGPNLAIITNAGGPGVMATDYLAGYGLEPAPLSEATMAKLNAVAPAFWSHGNPIDLTGAATPQTFQEVIRICRQAPELDALLVMIPPQALYSSEVLARDIAQALEGERYPTFAVWLGGLEMAAGRTILNQAGIPTYSNPEEAIRAFHYMYTYDRNLKLLQEIPTSPPSALKVQAGPAQELVEAALARGAGLLTEMESKALLKAYGIPTPRIELATTPEEAASLATSMGYPVVAKIHSHNLVHKSDAGGVRLNLHDAEQVRQAFHAIQSSVAAYDPQAHFGGVTIQPMLRCQGHEVIVGAKRDPDFGPVILFGMGGVFTELFRDRAIGLPPLNRILARRMIEETKVYQLLKGYRGQPAANLELLEEVLVRLSQLVADLPQVAELDINPLLLTTGPAYALDARVVVAASAVASPHHLAIGPYPAQYETWAETRTGYKLFIRPIKPEDAGLILEMFSHMSSQSVHQRFLRPLEALSQDILIRFTQIDYDRELALVALDESGPRPVMVGVTRLVSDPDGQKAIWTLAVGDPWQDQGVGSLLVEKAFQAARSRGIRCLWGNLLASNTRMIALHQRFGSHLKPVGDGSIIRATHYLDPE